MNPRIAEDSRQKARKSSARAWVTFSVLSLALFCLLSVSSALPAWALPGGSHPSTQPLLALPMIGAAAPKTVSLTISFYVQGGGTGYSSPIVTYVANGRTLSAIVGTSPSTFAVDTGTSWSVTNPLIGSYSSERWQTNQPTAGIMTTSQNVRLAFTHQFFVSFNYQVVGGGYGSSGPNISFMQFGTTVSSLSGQSVWADSGSSYSYPINLPGSTSDERWVTSLGVGTISSPSAILTTYYHQFLIEPGFSVNAGGNPVAPDFSYSYFGSNETVNLETPVQDLWADAGRYSFTDPLSSSGPTQRWYSPVATGQLTAPGFVSQAYTHQYLLAAEGVRIPSQWYDAGSTAVVNASAVYGRNATSGERISAYSLDGGSSVSISPPSKNVSVAITMSSSHTISFKSVAQYRVALDATTAHSLSSITRPTIAGDDYWYDAGSAVNVTLNGVWGRASGTGSRLTSYSVNGEELIKASTKGTIRAFSTLSLSSPETITAVSVGQFLLSTPTGSKESITPPSISGDAGWYDAGTNVTVNYDYSWNSTGQSRSNAIGYSVDGSRSALTRGGGGTFAVHLAMGGLHTIQVVDVTQFQLAITGATPTATTQSPTHDGYYDAGSSIQESLSSAYLGNARVRQILVSYTLDGNTTSLSGSGMLGPEGVFTTPVIRFDRPHVLKFNLITQYLISFIFTDGTGSTRIIPSSFEVHLPGNELNQTMSTPSTWIDNGTKFGVTNIMWENTNVEPANPVVYVADAPLNVSIPGRVYSANVVLTDLVGQPLQSVPVTITLANHTTIHRVSTEDGTISIAMIPLGTVNGNFTYLGVNSVIRGDAASQVTIQTRVPISLPDLALSITGTATLIGVVVLVWYNRRSRRNRRGFGRLGSRIEIKPTRR